MGMYSLLKVKLKIASAPERKGKIEAGETNEQANILRADRNDWHRADSSRIITCSTSTSSASRRFTAIISTGAESKSHDLDTYSAVYQCGGNRRNTMGTLLCKSATRERRADSPALTLHFFDTRVTCKSRKFHTNPAGGPDKLFEPGHRLLAGRGQFIAGQSVSQ